VLLLPQILNPETMFVLQSDVLLETATVRESLAFNAALQLPPTTTPTQRNHFIDQLLSQLGLQHCSNTLVGDEAMAIKGISGGERRRLAIGLELIRQPQIIFCDEPTTGLDSATALTVTRLLSRLARQQRRLVVMSIHQPGQDICHHFDDLLLMAPGGRCAYMGSWGGAMEYFTGHLGLMMPPCTGVAEWFLALMTDRGNDDDDDDDDDDDGNGGDDHHHDEQQGAGDQIGSAECGNSMMSRSVLWGRNSSTRGSEFLGRKSLTSSSSDSSSSKLGTAAAEAETCSSCGRECRAIQRRCVGTCSHQHGEPQQQQQQQLETAQDLCNAWTLAIATFQSSNVHNGSEALFDHVGRTATTTSSSSSLSVAVGAALHTTGSSRRRLTCYSQGCGWCKGGDDMVANGTTTTTTSSSSSRRVKGIKDTSITLADYASQKTQQMLLSSSGEIISPLDRCNGNEGQLTPLKPTGAVSAKPCGPAVLLVRDVTAADEGDDDDDDEGDSSSSTGCSSPTAATATAAAATAAATVTTDGSSSSSTMSSSSSSSSPNTCSTIGSSSSRTSGDSVTNTVSTEAAVPEGGHITLPTETALAAKITGPAAPDQKSSSKSTSSSFQISNTKSIPLSSTIPFSTTSSTCFKNSNTKSIAYNSTIPSTTTTTTSSSSSSCVQFSSMLGSSSSSSITEGWWWSTVREVQVLSVRSVRWSYRHPFMLVSQFLQYVFACVFLGSIYLRLPLTVSTGVPDRLSALFTFLVTLLVTAPGKALLAWNMERRLLR
jgi:ABC-type multidrug transport system ATPase subunit